MTNSQKSESLSELVSDRRHTDRLNKLNDFTGHLHNNRLAFTVNGRQKST